MVLSVKELYGSALFQMNFPMSIAISLTVLLFPYFMVS